MTPAQRELARHALGLPNRSRTSYRNYFVAGKGHPDYTDWMAMVEAGEAVRREGKTLPFAGDDCFYLTFNAALAARNRDEHLDREGFTP